MTRSTQNAEAVRPPKLRAGDHVRLVSPASTPGREDVEGTTRFLRGLGLHVTVGAHAFDELGYLAGKDEHRLDDLDQALRDPQIKAIIATRGGKGAYRIAGELDFAAAATKTWWRSRPAGPCPASTARSCCSRRTT